jgi:hypothetical protein
MMELAKFKYVLESTGLPVVYHSFLASGMEVKQPPYICWYVKESDNVPGDDKVVSKFNRVNIELYTDYKSPESEEKLEDALDGASIFYEKTELYIKEEKLFEVLYEIEI